MGMIFSHHCTQTYAIPFNFLATVIVNEKQYCNTSNYNQISVCWDSSKRKKCICGCKEPLISALAASNMVAQQLRYRDYLSFFFLSPMMHFIKSKLGVSLYVRAWNIGFISVLARSHWIRFVFCSPTLGSSIFSRGMSHLHKTSHWQSKAVFVWGESERRQTILGNWGMKHFMMLVCVTDCSSGIIKNLLQVIFFSSYLEFSFYVLSSGSCTLILDQLILNVLVILCSIAILQ